MHIVSNTLMIIRKHTHALRIYEKPNIDQVIAKKRRVRISAIGERDS